MKATEKCVSSLTYHFTINHVTAFITLKNNLCNIVKAMTSFSHRILTLIKLKIVQIQYKLVNGR